MPSSRTNSPEYLQQRKRCYKEIGLQLRKLRNEKGMTLSQAAERSGLADRHVAGIERWERHVPIFTLHELASVYGVKASDILREAGY